MENDLSPFRRQARKGAYYEDKNEELKMLVALMRQKLPAQVSNSQEKIRSYTKAFRGNKEMLKKVAVSYAKAHTPSEKSHPE